MRAALRGLASDDWVIGLAAAVAIGYATVLFLHSLLDLVVAIAQDRFSGGLSFTIAGREIPYEQPVLWGVTLAMLVVLSALLLRLARRNP